MPVIPALQSPEDCFRFKASLACTGSTRPARLRSDKKCLVEVAHLGHK